MADKSVGDGLCVLCVLCGENKKLGMVRFWISDCGRQKTRRWEIGKVRRWENYEIGIVNAEFGNRMVEADGL